MIKTEDDDRRRRRFGFLFLLLSIVRKKGRREKRKRRRRRRERESAVAVLHSLSLSLLLCFSTLSLFSRARESFSPLGFSFVRSFDIRLLTKQQQLFLFENKMQNNAKRSPRRRNTSRNSRTKRAGRICSSY